MIYHVKFVSSVEKLSYLNLKSLTSRNKRMDKKMRKVSRDLRKGERIIEKAARKNDRLADYDEKVRDPIIAKCKHQKKKKK